MRIQHSTGPGGCQPCHGGIAQPSPARSRPRRKGQRRHDPRGGLPCTGAALGSPQRINRRQGNRSLALHEPSADPDIHHVHRSDRGHVWFRHRRRVLWSSRRPLGRSRLGNGYRVRADDFRPHPIRKRHRGELGTRAVKRNGQPSIVRRPNQALLSFFCPAGIAPDGIFRGCVPQVVPQSAGTHKKEGSR